VGAGYHLDQFGWGKPQSDVHFVTGIAQFLKTGVGNLFGYQYTSHEVTFRWVL
jgi:hypothetical protein